jgi:hypothetical protein
LDFDLAKGVRKSWRSLLTGALAKAGELQTQRVEFGVRLLTGRLKHLLRIGANRAATWRWHLFGQFNHTFRG